ncbi:gamma-glutamyltransferase [Ectopseudomonas mendocina]|uniref:Glutathione hydrolase proenzyme n=1 Tax=Ectopseudomonas mendocina TaxID=300 RepID=A0ABZ2RP74_ECTME
MPRRIFTAFILLCTLNAYAASYPAKTAIATAHPAATVAGLETIAQGGNAFDAAIAISAALAVVEPYGSGLGGGGFFPLRKAGDKPDYRFIDARERAPAAAHAALYQVNGKVVPELSLNGALAAAIPGLPAGLVELAQRYGRLPLRDSLAPAIRLARSGVSIDRVYIERAQWRLEAMRKDKETARIFLNNGEVPEELALFRQPELARTLEQLGEQGFKGFYSGEVARKLVDSVRAAGGVWTLQDLADYRAVERQPLRVSLDHSRELITAPPPSAGGIAVAQSLLMLQQLPWQQGTQVQRTHLVVETLRRAYRDRGLLGDPDFIRNPVAQLLAPEHLSALVNSIDPAKATPSSSLPPSPAWHEGDHTTHFSVLDADGNAVAATLSVNLPFGAAFTVPGTGLLLNNEMDDFAADVQGSNAYGLSGSQANSVAAGKRPLSSMTPSFIESPEELVSFGTPGGSRIPSMVLLAMLEYLDNQPIARWPAVARYHHQYKPDVIEYEPGAFSPQQIRELEGLGHQLKATNRPYGNHQVLRWNKLKQTLEAASDPRGIGLAEPH